MLHVTLANWIVLLAVYLTPEASVIGRLNYSDWRLPFLFGQFAENWVCAGLLTNCHRIFGAHRTLRVLRHFLSTLLEGLEISHLGYHSIVGIFVIYFLNIFRFCKERHFQGDFWCVKSATSIRNFPDGRLGIRSVSYIWTATANVFLDLLLKTGKSSGTTFTCLKEKKPYIFITRKARNILGYLFLMDHYLVKFDFCYITESKKL